MSSSRSVESHPLRRARSRRDCQGRWPGCPKPPGSARPGRVEPEFPLAAVLVVPMTLKAFVREDRPDIAIEPDTPGLRSIGSRCGVRRNSAHALSTIVPPRTGWRSPGIWRQAGPDSSRRVQGGKATHRHRHVLVSRDPGGVKHGDSRPAKRHAASRSRRLGPGFSKIADTGQEPSRE